MAATAECDPETHNGTAEAFETEMTIVDDLPPVENENSAIECVSQAPASSAAPLELTQTPDAPVPMYDSPAISSSPVSSVAGGKARNTPRQSTRRSFTTEFKLECIEHAERTKNKTGTARKFNVNRRRIQEWCTQKEKLMGVPKQQKRLSGVKRQSVSDDKAGDVFTGGKPNADAPGSASTDVVSQELIDGQGLKAIVTPSTRPMEGIEALTPDAIVESIVRGLSLADLSLLPASMLRMIHDLSAEVASQDARNSMESMLQETSMDNMLTQKGVDVLPSQPVTQEVPAGRDLQATTLAAGLQEASLQRSSVGGGVRPDSIPAAVAVEAMDTENQQTGGVATERSVAISTPMAETPFAMMDVTDQTAMLDTLMQVATSMQVTANDLLQSMTVPAGDQPAVHSTSLTDVTAAARETTPVTIELNSEVAKENKVLSNIPSSPTGSVEPPGTTLEEGTVMEEAPSEDPVSSAFTSATKSMASLRTKVKKYYTVDFKLDCVTYAELNSKCAAARHFNVDRRRVQDWCSQKKKLLHLSSISTVERRPDETGIEEQLAAVVKQQLESGKPLTRRMVKDEAVKIFRVHGNATHIPSTGWVAKFMIRNNISLVPSTRSLPSANTTEVAEDSVGEFH